MSRYTKRNIQKKGGDIHAKTIFEKILSIGYEMETTDLAKLTLTSEDEFLNTDTARKDLAKLNSDISEDDDYFDQYVLRQEETFEEDFYVNEKVDKDVVFYITNDIANSPFVKELDKICGIGEETDSKIKNEMYKIRMKNKDQEVEDKPITFLFWNDKVHCSVFSDVEWIFTHYKPAKSKSVIIDTFFISIRNLIRHLDGLSTTTGELILTPEEEDEDIVVKHPKARVLFHKPDSNLYYLQTDNYKEDPLMVDKICLVPQMTFSTHISELFPVLKQLTSDSFKTIPSIQEKFDDLLTFLNLIDNLIQELVKGFNESYPDHAIKSTNKILYKSMKNYLGMMFYKLHIYINHYAIDKKANKSGYLKDYLTFNSRHSNYVLYNGLKKCLTEYYSNTKTEEDIIRIIRNLILQQSILEEFLLEDKSNVRKNAFSPTNILEKQHKQYGNPSYSLYSYLQFFEEPLEYEENDNYDDSNISDWLVYKKIDIYSTPMELKDDVVLTEFRGFSRALNSYMYSTGNTRIKELMTEGICNIRAKKLHANLGGSSIETLRTFIELLDSKEKSKKSKTRKSKSKSNSKSNSKNETKN